MNKPGAARDLTKSDTANANFSWVMITSTAGSLIIDSSGGNQTTLAAVPTGVWIPVGAATNIRTASTAVGLMVA